jgi:hypothetical protein
MTHVIWHVKDVEGSESPARGPQRRQQLLSGLGLTIGTLNFPQQDILCYNRR